MSNPHITALEELRDWLRGLAQDHRNNAARLSPESVFAIGNLAFAKDRDKWADALDTLLAEREKMVAEIDRLRGGIASHLQTIAALEAVVRDREGFGGCESCGVPFQSDDDGVSMGDVYFCAKCYAEWKAEYDACEHEWGEGEYEGDRRICNKCNGYEPESPELAACPQPPKGGEDDRL